MTIVVATVSRDRLIRIHLVDSDSFNLDVT